MTSPKRSTIVARAAAVVMVPALLLGILPGRAEAARTVTDACPPGKVPEDGFTDTGADGSRDESAIDCIAGYRVTLGKTATAYDPAGTVQRQQMATFVMRVFDLLKGSTRPAGAADKFPDDRGTHEANINDAAALDIVRGYPTGRFGPVDSVRRDQMASFIVRLLTTAGITIPSNPGNAFGDDNGNTHERNINVLASFDIVEGISAGSYGPSGFVTRAQMALFLTRTLDLLVDEGKVSPLGTIETYAVSGARTSVAFAANRTCTVTVPTGTVVDLALVPGDHITTTAGGAVRFRDANGDDRADTPPVAPEIASVEGDTSRSGDIVTNVTSDGSITVVITEENTASAVTLLVWADPASGNNQLDLVPATAGNTQPKAPAESYGFGCETVFGPPEAPAGASTPTVGSVDRPLDLFTSTNNLTYLYDDADTFQIAGTGVGKAQFEGVLSVGDVLSVSYNPGASAPSVFNITSDDVRAATNVVATVFNADNGATSNDVRITFTPNPLNGPATIYEVQRGQVLTVSCSAGGPPPVQWTPIEDKDTADGNAVDPNQSGCYQYRVVSKNPSPSASQATSEPSNRVESPDATRPTLVDARLVTDRGTAGKVDAGDEHVLVFSEPMAPTSAQRGASYRVASAGPNELEIACGLQNTTCSLNANPQTVGGTTYGPNTVLNVTVGTPFQVTDPPGRGPDVTYPATISGARGIRDQGGNELRAASDEQGDKVIDIENS